MASKNENGKTAVEVCTERLGDIGALLDQIGHELDARFKPLEEAGVSWSDAGDLGRVREDLVQTLQNIRLQLPSLGAYDTFAQLSGRRAHIFSNER